MDERLDNYSEFSRQIRDLARAPESHREVIVRTAEVLARTPPPRLPRDVKALFESGLSAELARIVWRFAADEQRGGQSTQDVTWPAHLWQAAEHVRAYFDGQVLTAFARAAGWARDGKLLSVVWELLEPRVSLTSNSVRVLANAGRHARAERVLERLVIIMGRQRPPVDGPAIGALATACAKIARADLLDEVWQLRVGDAGDLGSFATAWVDLDRPERFTQVWKAFLDEGVWESVTDLDHAGTIRWSRMWGAFAAAASRNDSVSIADIWRLSSPFTAILEDRTLVSFAESAARGGERAVLAEAAERLLSRNVDEAVLASLMTSAGHSSNAVLVDRIWSRCEALKSLLDSTVQRAATAIRYTGAVKTFERLWKWIELRQPSLDGAAIGALALCCVALKQPAGYLARVWQLRPSDGSDLGAMAKAAMETDSPELLELVWQAAKDEIAHVPLPSDPRQANRASITWCSLALAAAHLERQDLLTQIWQAMEKRGGIRSNEFGSFAAAAANAHNFELLRDVIRTALSVADSHDSQTWAALADACGDVGDAELLRCVWEAMPNRERLTKEAWGVLANAAGNVQDSVLLAEMFEAWPASRVAFTGTGHATWASFLSSTLRIRDGELFVSFLQTFERQFDPAKYPTRGTLQGMLWAATSLLPPIHAQITFETLIGLRIDVNRMLGILRDEGSGPHFEGAARCLVKWIVNSFFHQTVDEYRANLRRLVTGILALADPSEAWIAIFCRGKEAFVGGLQHRQLEPLQSLFQEISTVPDDDLPQALMENEIPARIAAFLESGVDTLPGAWIPTAESAAWKLEPLIGAYSANLVEYIAAGRDRYLLDSDTRREAYFAAVRDHIQSAGMETFSADDWVDALHWTITTTAAAVWPVMDHARWQTAAHQLKRRLAQQMEAFRGAETPEAKAAVATGIKTTVTSAWMSLNTRDSGRPLPLSIAFLLRTRLTGGRYMLPTTEVDIPETLKIAAWEGARNAVVEPLLFEIRNNAERALNVLPREKQLLKVSVALGTGEDSGHAVLTVTNALGARPDDPYSTRRGTAIIKRLATMLQTPRPGYASINPNDTLHGEPAFTVRVYFPLPDDGSPAAAA